MSESAFFQDLALLMTVAGVVSAVFSRFKWPKVIGYIFAGILLSEHTIGGCFLADPTTVNTVGQLGVVFLMFAMGLSFSTSEMRRIRSVALPCAAVDTIVMIWLGYTLGTRVFGWAPVPSLFLGVAICDSATTLLAKVIDEMGWSQRPFAKCVLGTSVCEDIICVGAIAVATGFATGGSLSLGTLGVSLGWLAVFFLATLVFGLILVPRLLASVAKREDDEALVLTTLGCCFFISFIAYRFDFSLALGAFLVGILGASSDVRRRLAVAVEPLKSMFAAVFFISIGLLVDPRACWRHLPEILLVSAVVVGGKFLNNAVVSLLTGCRAKTAIQNGLGLAQIGEFAFMVAMLYAGIAGDATTPMFQIAVGVSLLTTLLNLPLIRLSDRLGDCVERHLPARVERWLSDYGAWLAKIRGERTNPAFARLKAGAIRLGVYGVLILAVAAIASLLPGYDYSRISPFFERHDRLFLFLATNLFVVAMLPLVLAEARAIGSSVAELLVGEDETEGWLQPVRNLIRFVMLVATLALFFVEWTMINLALAPGDDVAVYAACAVVVVAGIAGWRVFTHAGLHAVERFQEALGAEDRQARLAELMSPSDASSRMRLHLRTDSAAVGSTVGSLNIRAKTGVSVQAIERDGVLVENIGADWLLSADDILLASGSNEQIAALKDLLGIVSPEAPRA